MLDAPEDGERDYKTLLQANEDPPTCPDDLLDQAIDEIDATLRQSDREAIHHFGALEVAIVYYERINQSLAKATAQAK